MNTNVTMEFDARFENGMRRALAMLEEMEQMALTAPDGQVVDICERAVLEKGRAFQVATLSEAVARRISAAEKKGRRSVSVHAGSRKRTAGPKRGGS